MRRPDNRSDAGYPRDDRAGCLSPYRNRWRHRRRWQRKHFIRSKGCLHYRSFSVSAGSFFPINAAACKMGWDSNIFGRRPSTSLIVVPQNWQEGIKRVMLQLRGCRYQLPVQQQRGGGIVIVGRYSEDLHRLKLPPHFLQRAGGTLLCLPGRIGGAPARGPQPGDKAKRSDRCEVQNCEPNTGHDAAQDFHPGAYAGDHRAPFPLRGGNEAARESKIASAIIWFPVGVKWQ